MKNRNMVVWGAVGAGALLLFGLLIGQIEAEEGFWGDFRSLVNLPAAYIWAFIISYFYGTVEGPPSWYRIFFFIFMGVVGFFIGILLRKLHYHKRKNSGEQE